MSEIPVTTYEFIVGVPKDMITKCIMLPEEVYEQACWSQSHTISYEAGDKAYAFVTRLTDNMLTSYSKISQTAYDKLFGILKSEATVATFTVTDAACMYNGLYAQTEPVMRILLTFNPVKVTVEECDAVATRLANRLATEFDQVVVPGYRHQAMSIVGRK